jgi:hypothetical protein
MHVFHVFLNRFKSYMSISDEKLNNCNLKTDVGVLACIKTHSSDRIVSGTHWRLKSTRIY